MNWGEVRDFKDPSDPDIIRGSVVGVSFVDGYPTNLHKLLARLQEQGTLPATITRNPNNEYDSNACQVWVGEEYIGHLSKDMAAEVAPHLDSGGHVELTIVSIGFANEDVNKPGASYHLKYV